MDELLEKYKNTFGECFPLMLTKGMSDDYIVAIINECLKKHKPYETDSENDY